MDLREYLETHPPQGFKPLPHFRRVGDMLDWYWSDEEGYAEPFFHDGVHVGSLIRSFRTKQVVGVKINGVIKLVEGSG